MKRSIFITLIIIAAYVVANAQPSSVKKAGKSLFKLTTYTKDGSIKSNTTHGVFINSNGECVGLWTPFINAERATVTDINGNTLNVETIIGANELYDVCKFKVNGTTTPANVASQSENAGNKVWLAEQDGNKINLTQHNIEKKETFMDKYSFYIFSSSNTPDKSGLPFINNKGEIIGIMHLANGTSGIHAVDTKFIDNIKVDGLSINSPLFKQTGIRLELPKDKEQALIMLMMSSEQKDSLQHTLYIDDFIKHFPNDIDGYAMRALRLVDNKMFDEADKLMLTAIEKVKDKAEAHAEYSRIIYQKMLYSNDTTYTNWNLNKALDEITEAYKINPKPVYKHREAQIEYSKGEYLKAYDKFIALTKEKLNHEELFFEAAQCKTQLNAPKKEIIILLDSAIASCPKPLTPISAPYILARGQVLDEMGEYRKALSDYNKYDTLMLGRADASFYYSRYKCELQIKQYQQALNDIAHAAFISPGEPIYLAELASLQLRLNQIDDAIKTSDLCISLTSEYSDPYIIKGIALAHKMHKQESIKCFEKAKELGDSRADGLIEKYK